MLVEHLRAGGNGPNILITGETGSGKTSVVEAYARTLFCLHATEPLLGPCGQCDNCMTFDFEYGDYGLFARPIPLDGVITHFYHINCCNFSEPEILELTLDISHSGNDRSIVFLDEIQELTERKRDRLLLKPIQELNAIWIGAGITTDVLYPPFVRRFAMRCRTGLPSGSELALFLLDRCQEWEISYDNADTFGLLAERSGQITAECISVLARAAGREGRRLDRELVMRHPFIAGVTQ